MSCRRDDPPTIDDLERADEVQRTAAARVVELAGALCAARPGARAARAMQRMREAVGREQLARRAVARLEDAYTRACARTRRPRRTA